MGPRIFYNNILGAVGGLASALIPGAAPIVAAVSGVASALSGGGGGGSAGPTTAVSTDPTTDTSFINYFGTPADPKLLADPTVTTLDTSGALEAPRTWLPSVATDPNAGNVIGYSSGGITVNPANIAGGALSFIPSFTIPASGMGVATILGGGTVLGGAIAVGRALLPTIEKVVPKLLLSSSVAASIYELYKRFRAAGVPHKRARRQALAAAGVILRRRRMRVTNVHALHRAIRRVHGFKRVARKVGALGVGRHRLLPARYSHRRHHYRRGDVDPFAMEELAAQRDEAEDFDLQLGSGPEEAIYE